MRVEELSMQAWREALPETGTHVFHRPEALSILEEHTSGTLRLLGGFKGDRVVALLPLFVRDGPLSTSTVTSPPPGMHVPHLGPILMPASPKQRKREKLNKRFVESALEAVNPDGQALYFIVCGPSYQDPRPYEWNGLSVEVLFTYHIELGDRSLDEVLNSMSKGRRREIRKGQDLDVTVEHGDLRAARYVYEESRDRLLAQDEPFSLTWEFVRYLLDALGDRARVHVARGPDGELLGGVIALYSNDSACFWLGGTRGTYEDISINSLVHWDIIRTIHQDPTFETVSQYDMVGANIPRLSKYKSKFGPGLQPYYVVKSSGPKMMLAEAAHSAVNSVNGSLAAAKDRYASAAQNVGLLRSADGRNDLDATVDVSQKR